MLSPVSTKSLIDMNVWSRYIGSDKAIADLPFFNGNVSGVCHLSHPTGIDKSSF